MFSIKTRRRIVTGLIVLVYAGILAFVPLVMWPRMKKNSTDIKALEEAQEKVAEWRRQIQGGQFEATAAHVAVRQQRLDEVRAAYGEMKEYCMARDTILERANLLDTTRPYDFKQDYLSLLNHWRERAPHSETTTETSGLQVSPSYKWAEEEGAMPAVDTYEDIIKQTAVVDTVVRLFSQGRADIRLQTVSVGEPRKSKNEPQGPGDVQFGAARYRIWPATVTGLAPFSTDFRRSIHQVVTAPQHTVKAPTRVKRHPEEPRYLPGSEESYILPFVRIRSLEFEPAEVNWVQVTAVIDIYDFSAREPKQ